MTEANAKILIVDDDPQLLDLLKDYLSQFSYEIHTAKDGVVMWQVLEKISVDLIILDIMLPGDDGLTLCRKLRETSNAPIIMLSAVGDETDRIIGLEVGADDYLSKPFSTRELLARIKALLRRSQQAVSAGTSSSIPTYKFSGWTLSCAKRQLISPEGLTVPLSAGEYELLMAFIEHPQRNLSRDQLLDFSRGKDTESFDRAVDVQVARLRKKLEVDPKDPKIIITHRGAGYMFTPKITQE